jgi:hypothetical protein
MPLLACTITHLLTLSDLLTECQQYLSSLRDIPSAEAESGRQGARIQQEQHRHRHDHSVRHHSIYKHDRPPQKEEDQVSLLSYGVRFENWPFTQSTLI